MNLLWRARLVVVFLIMFGSRLAQSQPEPLTISGYILEAGTGQPIEGAAISIVGNAGKRDDVSDSRGAFNIPLASAVSKGDTIEIRVSKPGYKSYNEKISVSELALRIVLQKEGSRGSKPDATLFSVDVTSAITIPNLFWVVGPSPLDDGVSPVDVVVILNIVNRQSKAAAISTFSLAVKTGSGAWMPLNRIQTIGKTLFPYVGSLNHAVKVKFFPADLETLLGPDANFGPGVTVRGSGLFQYSSKRYCHRAGAPMTFRIILGDTTHHRLVIETTTPTSADPDALGDGWSIVFMSGFKDLTGLKGAEKSGACLIVP